MDAKIRTSPGTAMRRAAWRLLAAAVLGLGIWGVWQASRPAVRFPEKLLLEDFQRPLDRDLVAQFGRFERTGVAEFLDANVIKPFLDDVQTAGFNADGLEVTPAALPHYRELSGIVQDCARILAMPAPRVYIVSDPEIQALTTNFKDPAILLHSALLERFTERAELRFIIGHEMAHVKCGHVKWKMLLRLAVGALRSAKAVPEAVAAAPLLPVLKWARESEMSADNAGLICCQDLRAAEQALLRLVHGGGGGQLRRVDVEAYLRQSAAQEVGKFAEVLQYWREVTREHPFVNARILQLREYAKSRQYLHLWE